MKPPTVCPKFPNPRSESYANGFNVIPGVLGSEESSIVESHAESLLEGPQYTRPANFRGWGIPEILLSGNHQKITRWRRNQALLRTALRRPDLINQADLTDDEKIWLKEELSERNIQNE